MLPTARNARRSLRARPDGRVAGFPHRLRGDRNRAAAPDGARGAALAADARPRIPRSGETLVERGGCPLRGRRGVGDGSLLRAGPSLPHLHETRGPARLHALFAGGIRLFHRGDLPRHLPLRLEARAREGACRRRLRGGRERRRVRALRHHGQRVDERAARISRRGAPLHVGPLEIPGALSILAHGDPNAVVTGLDAFAPRDRPPRAVKPLFQAMVLFGMLLAAHAAWSIWLRVRSRPFARRFLIATAVVCPRGFVALKAGCGVTEPVRQPWIIYGVMRTADAVTPMPCLIVPFTVFVLVYLFLSAAVVALLRDQFRETT